MRRKPRENAFYWATNGNSFVGRISISRAWRQREAQCCECDELLMAVLELQTPTRMAAFEGPRAAV